MPMVPAKPKELQHAVRRPCSGKELLLSPLTHSDEGKARVPTKANPLVLPACVPTVLFFTILDLSQEPGKQRLFPSSVLTRDGEGHQPRGRRKMTKREQARATFFRYAQEEATLPPPNPSMPLCRAQSIFGQIPDEVTGNPAIQAQIENEAPRISCR